MYGPKDSFTVRVPVNGLEQSSFYKKTYGWINKERVFGSVQIEYEKDNEIKVKSPVRFFSNGIFANWYFSPKLYYYYTFIFNENMITVHAEVQFPTNYPRIYLINYYIPKWYRVLKCREFLQTYFDYLGVSNEVSFREVYPRDELELPTWNRKRVIFFSSVILHVFITIFGLMSEASFKGIIWYNICMLIGDFLLFVLIFFPFRRYAKIMNYEK